jgi:Tfp pilus assembly protein PilX
MKPRSVQRGFMLIVGIFLLVVAAVFASVIAFRTVSSNESSGNTLTHTQALYLAQTGIERWIRQRALNNAFTGEVATAFGNGTFTTTTNTLTDCSGNALAANRARVRSVGDVASTNASATLCVVVDLMRLGGAMMVYAQETSAGVPFILRWSHPTNAWVAGVNANDVGPVIVYAVLKFARTRNEAILVTMDSGGGIDAQIWNGTTSTWSAIRTLAAVTAANSVYRGFDVEYESLGDRAVVVYNNDNAASPAYQIWTGTAWIGEVSIATQLPGGVYHTDTPGVPRWIEVAANPLGNSNEIVMISADDGDDVYGVRWNGTTWSRISAGNAAWDTTAAPTDAKMIDVAYEQSSGTAMFIWGDDVDDQQRWRTWDGTTLSAIANLGIAAMGGSERAEWVRLVANPYSDQIMYAVQDEGGDLNTCLWSGTAWDCQAAAHPEHDGDVENIASMNFDFVFETHPSNRGVGWLMWGTNPGGGGNTDGVVNTRRWSGAAWGAIAQLANTDDTSFIRLASHVSSGTVFSGIYENSTSAGGAQDDIYESHQTGGGGAWTAIIRVWDGGTTADPVSFRIDIASERYTPIVNWQEILP